MAKAKIIPDGFKHLSMYLNGEEQVALLEQLRVLILEAPLYHAQMPKTGKALSAQNTNLGSLGWVSDIKGYRYQETHPVTGKAWPEIPQQVLNIWRECSGYDYPPEACLVNYYTPDARLGLHVDMDEKALHAPIVTISLGDSALFRLGGPNRKDPTCSFKVLSGDVVVMAGASRMCYHGVDRIYPNTSTLLKSAGRISLTMRRVNPPE